MSWIEHIGFGLGTLGPKLWVKVTEDVRLHRDFENGEMVMTMRYGLLGAGMMGREHLRNLALFDDIEVVGICEPDLRMQEKTLAQEPNAQFVQDLPALLSLGLDALVIATPNYQHIDQLMVVIEQCDIPILVEKPVVTRLEDIARIRAGIAAQSKQVWVGMEYRFMPALTLFANEIGQVGPPTMLNIREHRYPFLKKVNDWNRFNRFSGGTFVEKCCHFFDLMRLFLNADPVRVFASGGQDVNHLDERYDGEQPDILDNGFVVVEFENGCRAMLDLCMFTEGVKFEQEISLVGDKGRLDCQIPGPLAMKNAPESRAQVTFSPRRSYGPEIRSIEVGEDLLRAGSHQGATYYQHKAFLARLQSQSAPAVSLDDGLKAVLVGLAAQASISSHQAIEIDCQQFILRPVA